MKNLIAFAIIFLIAMSAMASEKLHFGATAGLNLANLTSEDEDDETAMKMGFNLGLVMNYELAPMFSLQPGILFSMKGAKSDETDASVALNYIEVPVLAKVTPVKSANFDFGFFAGPYLGIKLSEAFYDENGDKIEIPDTLEDWYTTTDFGLSFGLGAGVPLGLMKLGLNAGYSLGLSNVINIPDDWPEGWEEPTVKTTNIFINAILFFN